MDNELRRDDKGKAVQAFALQEDRTGLTSGTYEYPFAIHCVSAGSIIVTWKSNSTENIALADGDEFTFRDNAKSVEISSGTFHLMTR